MTFIHKYLKLPYLSKIFLICLSLAAIHLTRIGIKSVVFVLIEQTESADTLVSLALSLAFVVLLYICTNKKSLYPEKLNTWWLSAIILTALMFLSSIYFHLSGGLLRLVYNVLFTPLYEELIFRDIVWKALDTDNHRFGWLINAVLFGLWHFGYVDSVVWRMTLRGAEGNLLSIMLWKVITGAVLGLVFAFLKKKTGKTLAPFLAHCFINSFGG